MISKMSDSSYFALPAVSNSLLSRFAKCPAAASIQLEPTAAMNLGSALHCAVLEGQDEFLSRFYVMDKVDGRTKEGKAARAQAELDAEGKTIITMDDFDKIMGIAESILAHPSASTFLQSGKPEMAITWECPETGIALKAKADYLAPGLLLDLKTPQDSGYSVFSKTIVNMGYYRQFAMYRDGLRANLHPVDRCIIIAVSTNAPYETECYELDEELLEYGQGEYKRLLREYQACCEAESFPAYRYAGVHTVRLPQWMKEIQG